MARPKQNRLLQSPLNVKGFMPSGYYGKEKESVILLHEELESLRLLDYEGLNQKEAATLMEVSRPTFTRIYEMARKKIATAFIEARQIKIEGGQAIFKGEWYSCNVCESKFNNPLHISLTTCALCGSHDFEPIILS